MTRDVVAEFRHMLPFRLDPFQDEAIRALAEGRSVLVAAPTGTGKTVIAEFAVHMALSRGLRALYTTPIKALSNQKFRDFRGRYGEQVGLLTGDLSENPSGRLLVMTTEVARNMLIQDAGSFRDVGCLIFDEVHYLADPERGTAWEESILLAPAHVALVCLSATVSNAGEVAEWIGTTGREVALVQSNERTVPLRHRYYLDGCLHPILDEDASAKPLAASSRQRLGGHGKTSHPSRNGAKRSALNDPIAPGGQEVVRALESAGLLPAIYFLFSRKAVEEAADGCQRLHLLSRDEATEVRQRVRQQLSDLSPEDRGLAQVERMADLLPKGVGFHHAGLLPPLKTLAEELLAAGRVKVVFATDTLALGINVPARSVVLGEMVKFDGRIRRPLLPGEYRQLTGRAGRRGMDPVGYSVLLDSPDLGLDRSIEIATGGVAPLESAFRPNYSTVLNLWKDAEHEEELARLIAGSLRQFQHGTTIRSLMAEREALQSALDGLPAGCPLDGGPTNWLEHDRQLRRENERAESALEAVLRSAERARVGGTGSRERGRLAHESAEDPASMDERLTVARERLGAASRAMMASPCRSCPIRAVHRRSDRERRSYAGQLAATERDLEATRRESRRAAERAIRSLRSVLESFGYMDRGHPTLKANCLKRIFDSNSLVIAELLDWGVLADASGPEIAEVASWFAFDREGSARAMSLTERLGRMRSAAESVAKTVLEVERRHRIDLSHPLPADFRGITLAWTTGASLADISARSGLAEGDVVFALQKTIDLCRQIAHAATRSRTPALAKRATDAASLLRRGVVDSYYRWVVGDGGLDAGGGPDKPRGAA